MVGVTIIRTRKITVAAPHEYIVLFFIVFLLLMMRDSERLTLPFFWFTDFSFGVVVIIKMRFEVNCDCSELQ